MEIIVNGQLASEGVLKMGSELKKIFDEAKKDQRSKLFSAFAAIAAHIVTEKSISELFKAVGLDGPPIELTPFFKNNNLLDDAKTAFNMLATVDNTDPDSWGSFMEFSQLHYS